MFKDYGSVGLYIDFGKGYKGLNKKVFDFLYEHRSEFEKALGKDLEWKKTDKQRSCLIYKKIYEGGTFKIERWDELQNKMVDSMFKLYNVLQKYIPGIEKIVRTYKS